MGRRLPHSDWSGTVALGVAETDGAMAMEKKETERTAEMAPEEETE